MQCDDMAMNYEIFMRYSDTVYGNMTNFFLIDNIICPEALSFKHVTFKQPLENEKKYIKIKRKLSIAALNISFISSDKQRQGNVIITQLNEHLFFFL